MTETQAISLLELQNEVQDALKSRFKQAIWVVAEVNELHENRNGHAYLDLVQKAEGSENIVAKSRAMVWANIYRMLKPYFETSTGHRLEAGIKIKVKAAVTYHEVFGFSLTISDIDPIYTIGDLEHQRRQTILKLEKEGIIDLNKETELPAIVKTIAVISSASAAGYGDFVNQLTNNSWGLKFHVKLFPAVMQGTVAESSIVSALERIFEYEDIFDAVVIIRGGGAKSDLSIFDQYWLAANIAQFPLPVLTGIGHDRDQSVADMVAHTSLKTPTAVAEFLIERNSQLLSDIANLEIELKTIAKNKMDEEKNRIQLLMNNLAPIIKHTINTENFWLEKKILHSRNLIKTNLLNHKNKMAGYSTRLQTSIRHQIKLEKQNQIQLKKTLTRTSNQLLQTQHKYLNATTQRKQLLDPENILKRGYSITYLRNKPITNAAEVNTTDELKTKLYNGELISTIKIIKK